MRATPLTTTGPQNLHPARAPRRPAPQTRWTKHRGLVNTNNPLAELAIERDSSNNLIRRYTYGANISPVSMTTTAGSFYYHYDPLGNVANLTDSSGTTQWTYSYEPYGNPLTTTQNAGSAPTNPIRYTGQYRDTTGLYNLRARQYDPNTGRFNESDPSPAGLTNPYAAAYIYGADAPTVQGDPSGQDGEDHPGLGGGDNAAAAADDARSGYITAADQARNNGIPDPYAENAEAQSAKPSEPYKRPSSARATRTQKAAVQGQPCVECGQKASKMYVNHEPPLVQQHYEHGEIDLENTTTNAHCPTCSNAQGGRLSHYSRQMNLTHFGP